jgi:hypothetical protein
VCAQSTTTSFKRHGVQRGSLSDGFTRDLLAKVKPFAKERTLFGGATCRYYFNIQPKAVKITVKVDGKHIGDSPYLFSAPIAVEKCACPRTFNRLYADYECHGSDPASQIDADMAQSVERLHSFHL